MRNHVVAADVPPDSYRRKGRRHGIRRHQPGGCDYFSHLLSWYARRNEADTLLLTYPWVTRNREKAVKRLAQFCRIELDNAQLSMVLQRTTREYMYTNKYRFDDAMVVRALEQRCGKPARQCLTRRLISGPGRRLHGCRAVVFCGISWAIQQEVL